MPKSIHFDGDEWVRMVFPLAEYPGWRVGDQLPGTLRSASGAIYEFKGTATVTAVEEARDAVRITVRHRKA